MMGLGAVDIVRSLFESAARQRGKPRGERVRRRLAALLLTSILRHEVGAARV